MDNQEERIKSKMLRSIFRQLFKAGIIPEDELNFAKDVSITSLELKAKIFDRMSNADLRVGNQILSIIKSTNENLNTLSAEKARVQNTMHVNTVIQRVYGFLSLPDIKKCRLVCQRWDYVALPLLRKRSVIKFSSGEENNRSKSIEEFSSVFSSSKLQLPFNSFAFSGDYGSIYPLEKFFEEQKQTMKELCFERIKIPLNYDINHWFSGANITKLFLNCYEASRIKICLREFTAVRDISLMHCSVDTDYRTKKIIPTKIHLSNLHFIQNGTKLDEYRLNDSIDFSNAQEIKLIFDSSDITKPILDLEECLRKKDNSPDTEILIQSMILNKVSISSWPTSSEISLNFLKMESMNFLEKRKLSLKEFDFDCKDDVFLDILALPDSLEKLTLRNPSVVQIASLRSFTLLNLKTLRVYYKYSKVGFLSYFSRCLRLTEIELINRGTKLFISALPPSVKKLKIEGPLEIQGPVRVETLILSSTLANLSRVVLEIFAEKLIIVADQSKQFQIRKEIHAFIHRLKNKVSTIYMGPFSWEGIAFRESCIANYADRKGKYYCFINQRGMAIDSLKEFSELAEEPVAGSSIQRSVLRLPGCPRPRRFPF